MILEMDVIAAQPQHFIIFHNVAFGWDDIENVLNIASNLIQFDTI